MAGINIERMIYKVSTLPKTVKITEQTVTKEISDTNSVIIEISQTGSEFVTVLVSLLSSEEFIILNTPV